MARILFGSRVVMLRELQSHCQISSFCTRPVCPMICIFSPDLFLRLQIFRLKYCFSRVFGACYVARASDVPHFDHVIVFGTEYKSWSSSFLNFFFRSGPSTVRPLIKCNARHFLSPRQEVLETWLVWLVSGKPCGGESCKLLCSYFYRPQRVISSPLCNYSRDVPCLW